MSEREGGHASITYLLATVLALAMFLLMANLLMFLYARAVVRAAVDEGARAGAVANGSEVECLERTHDVLADLLSGPLGSEITVECTAPGSLVVATANVTLTSPYPGIADWTFVSEAQATDESRVFP